LTSRDTTARSDSASASKSRCKVRPDAMAVILTGPEEIEALLTTLDVSQ
jgi:hypothetical protein